MPAKRKINKIGLLFWFMICIALWVIGSGFLAGLDRKAFNLAAHALDAVPQEQQLHLLWPGETAPPESDTYAETRSRICPQVGMVSLTDANMQACFAALPLGPQDMAVLLNNLSSCGARVLGISSPLSWQEPASGIAQQMICLSLANFSHTAVGLRGRTASQADFTPTVLRQYAIPPNQIEGDITGLPSANKAIPNDLLYATEALRLSWAPDWLEDEPLTQKGATAAGRSFPLLVRWNGEVLPTLPLCLALQASGLGAGDVQVRMGQDIRIGKNVFPLDAHGRTRLKEGTAAMIRLEDVVKGSGESLKAFGKDGLAILEQPPAGQQDAGRLQLMAATLSQLCAQEKVEKSKIPGAPGKGLRLASFADSWLQLATAAVILLAVLRFVPMLPAILGKIILLALPCCLLWQLRCGVLGGYWFHLSACFLVWLGLIPALHFLRPAEKTIFSGGHRR